MCPCFPVSFLLGHRTGQTDFQNDQREVSCEISCVSRLLGFLYSHNWTGTLKERLLGKCCCDFFFLFRKVSNSLIILGREPCVGPYDPFLPQDATKFV